MLIFATVAAGKNPEQVTEQKNLVARNVRIEKAKLPDLGTLAAEYDGQLVFSRIMRGDTPDHEGAVEIATEHTEPRQGDILTIVGEREQVEKAIEDLGHASSVALHLDRRYLDFRRFTMSNTKLSGRRISDLDLERKFGATITRVRRGDVDLLATDDLVVLTGDRLRIVAPRGKLREVSAFFGDSETSTAHLDAASLGIGLSLGVLLGLLIWPLPGGNHFALGVAGGSLVVGLILGRVMRTGPFVWTLPYGTSNTLGQLGMLLFLAYAGSTAGPAFLRAVHSDQLPWILLAGFIITTLFACALLLFGRYLAKIDNASLAGTLAGAGTQPAVLAHANELVNSSNVNLGYALVYPAAMIAKVIIAPLIGTLF
jgi:putative transport protein